ncbi:MAG TPA: DNA translocase FtsK 4TM domain-containing protein, partial [Bryobacteraceae bacterium]
MLGLAVVLSLISYSPADPSWNTASGAVRTHNLLGLFGAQWADFFLQIFGLSAFLLPLHVWALSWKWFRSASIESPKIRLIGGLALWFSLSAACGLLPLPFLIGGTIRPSGIVGMVIADYLVARLNMVGALIAVAVVSILALYLASTFEVSTLQRWLSGPLEKWKTFMARWREARQLRREQAIQRAKERAAERVSRRSAQVTGAVVVEGEAPAERPKRTRRPAAASQAPSEEEVYATGGPATDDVPPFDLEPGQEYADEPEGIPIRMLEEQPVVRPQPTPEESEEEPRWEEHEIAAVVPVKKRKKIYRLPSTALLNEAPPGSGYDSQELQEVASRIKSKLEEFNVRGSVVQINPGPVVTTF